MDGRISSKLDTLSLNTLAKIETKKEKMSLFFFISNEIMKRKVKKK
jgi:hypothetical protein